MTDTDTPATIPDDIAAAYAALPDDRARRRALAQMRSTLAVQGRVRRPRTVRPKPAPRSTWISGRDMVL